MTRRALLKSAPFAATVASVSALACTPAPIRSRRLNAIRVAVAEFHSSLIARDEGVVLLDAFDDAHPGPSEPGGCWDNYHACNAYEDTVWKPVISRYFKACHSLNAAILKAGLHTVICNGCIYSAIERDDYDEERHLGVSAHLFMNLDDEKGGVL